MNTKPAHLTGMSVEIKTIITSVAHPSLENAWKKKIDDEKEGEKF